MTTQTDPDQRPRIMLINGIPMATSWAIAEHFDKEHRNVLRSIEETMLRHAHRSEFVEANFIRTTHIDSRGKAQPIFRLTEFAFMTVVMGFTGKRATDWQWLYGQTFIKMREALMAGALDANSDAAQRILLMQHDQAALNDQVRDLKYDLEYAQRRLAEERAKLRHVESEYMGVLAFRVVAEQMLTDGYSADTAMSHATGLVFTVADMQQLHTKEMSHLIDMLKEAKFARQTIDPDRAGSAELYLLLQHAYGGGAVTTDLLWALIVLRATVENMGPVVGKPKISVHSPAAGYTSEAEQWTGRPVSLTRVMELTGTVHTRRALLAAVRNLADKGVLVIKDRATFKGREHQFQLRLGVILETLRLNRNKLDWIMTKAPRQMRWHELTFTLPEAFDKVPSSMLFQRESPDHRRFANPRDEFTMVLSQEPAPVAAATAVSTLPHCVNTRHVVSKAQSLPPKPSNLN